MERRIMLMFSPFSYARLAGKIVLVFCCLTLLLIASQVAHASPSIQKHSLVSGTVIALQADTGLYLSRINYGGAGGRNPIEAAKGSIDPYSQFTVTLLNNGKIALQADTGLYLSRINYGGAGGRNPIEAAKGSIDPYSQFTLIPLSNGKIALQADTGLYLSRINYGGAGGRNPIEAAKGSIDPYSQFTMTILS